MAITHVSIEEDVIQDLLVQPFMKNIRILFRLETGSTLILYATAEQVKEMMQVIAAALNNKGDL